MTYTDTGMVQYHAFPAVSLHLAANPCLPLTLPSAPAPGKDLGILTVETQGAVSSQITLGALWEATQAKSS